MKQSLTILYLYPTEMNIYGDRGNVLTLQRRLEWRGIGAQVIEAGVGDTIDWDKIDIVFAGGGQDRGQVAVGRDLQQRADAVHAAVKRGVVMLTICGTYQLFTRGFTTNTGEYIPGIGVFAAETIADAPRLIGNTTVHSDWGELIGFENHSGMTYLDPGLDSLGKANRGGNNPTTGEEGAVMQNAFGSYLHGPILPKNPEFADHLLQLAIERKYPGTKLKPLNNEVEIAAAELAKTRPR